MLLFTPGPTPTPEFVRNAISSQTIHHRTKEFKNIFSNTIALMKEFLKMDEVVFFAATGTGAMEASIINFFDKKCLIINAGKFGERFSKICKAYGIEHREIKYDYDTPANADDIIEAIEDDEDIDLIALQVCESTGGLRHPVEEISRKVKEVRKDILVVADGITAVGVEKVDTENIDVLIGGSQKAFMLPPGLSFVGLSEYALSRIKARGFYFNILNELKKQKEFQTAFTAATVLIIGLEIVLKKIFEIGVEKFFDDTKKRAFASRKAIESIGLALYPKSPAVAMSAVLCKESEEVRKILKDDFEVNVAGGQEFLKGKIFRINHMGFIEPYEAAWVLNSVELALDKIGIREFKGTANSVFNSFYFKEKFEQ